MTEVQEVLYRYYKGISFKQIAQSLGIARNTVREIVRLAQGFGLKGKQGTEAEFEEVVQKVIEVRLPPCIPKGPLQTLLGTYHQQLETWWQCQYMTATQMARLLAETYHITISDRSMRRYVERHFKKTSRGTVHLETQPGDQGQVDFGYVGMMKDPLSQKMRKAYAFVLTLSYSRYRFVCFVFRQDVATWVDCHIRAFHFFGGVPKSLIPDYVAGHIINFMFPSVLCSLKP